MASFSFRNLVQSPAVDIDLLALQRTAIEDAGACLLPGKAGDTIISFTPTNTDVAQRIDRPACQASSLDRFMELPSRGVRSWLRPYITSIMVYWRHNRWPETRHARFIKHRSSYTGFSLWKNLVVLSWKAFSWVHKDYHFTITLYQFTFLW